MKDYRFIGKATTRKDALDIVTGKTKFINDLSFPNMLYAKVLRSPFPHALIKSIDTAKAMKLPGVKAVLTYKDVPDWMGGLPRHVRVLDSKVRYVGDAVALVAAETEEIGEEALRLIRWSTNPYRQFMMWKKLCGPRHRNCMISFRVTSCPGESGFLDQTPSGGCHWRYRSGNSRGGFYC